MGAGRQAVSWLAHVEGVAACDGRMDGLGRVRRCGCRGPALPCPALPPPATACGPCLPLLLPLRPVHSCCTNHTVVLGRLAWLDGSRLVPLLLCCCWCRRSPLLTPRDGSTRLYATTRTVRPCTIIRVVVVVEDRILYSYPPCRRCASLLPCCAACGSPAFGSVRPAGAAGGVPTCKPGGVS